MLRGAFAWPALFSAVALGVGPDQGQSRASAAATPTPASGVSRSQPAPPSGVGGKSYNKLFRTAIPAATPAQTTPSNAPPAAVWRQPRVVCGMTLMEVDPALDPKIRIERPPDRTRYAIKIIEPATCR